MIKGLVCLFFWHRCNVSAIVRARFTATLKWQDSRSLQRINMGKSRHDWYILVDGLWVEIHIQNDVQKWNRKVKFLRFSEASWCTKLFQVSELKCYQGDTQWIYCTMCHSAFVFSLTWVVLSGPPYTQWKARMMLAHVCVFHVHLLRTVRVERCLPAWTKKQYIVA